MAASRDEHPVMPPGSQQPDWEVPRNCHTQASIPPKEGIYTDKQYSRGLKTTAVELLDKTIPPHRTYLGLRRRYFLSALTAAIILVILAIGLGVGLNSHSGNEDLPLPTNAKTFTGDLTYYSPALGACGITSSDSDDICAVSHTLFDAASHGSNPNANPLCGLKIRATRFNPQVNGNRSVDLTVVDRCVGCKATDIDLSPSAFEKLADPAAGRVRVTWAWLSPIPSS